MDHHGTKDQGVERQIADYCGVKRAVCLNSQTACAEMALRILGIGPGDEVITSAYTYTASASVICHVGARPVLVDTQPDSLEMDYDALEKAVTKHTKAVIPVDIGGIPCDYDRIFSVAERKKALFRPANQLQEAMGGSRYVQMLPTPLGQNGMEKDRKHCGFLILQFPCSQEPDHSRGGALTWNPIPGIGNEDIYHQLQLYSLHGQSKDALAKTQLGAWEYDIAGPWYKCNMTDIMAAIGLAQLRRYEGLLMRRKEIIRQYDQVLRPVGVGTLEHYTSGCTSSGHLYLTWIPGISLEQRQEIIVKMAEAGVACNVHYKPLPMMTAYKNMGFDMKDYPNAYGHFVNEITLPLHTKLLDAEVTYVAETYASVVKPYIQKREKGTC